MSVNVKLFLILFMVLFCNVLFANKLVQAAPYDSALSNDSIMHKNSGSVSEISDSTIDTAQAGNMNSKSNNGIFFANTDTTDAIIKNQEIKNLQPEPSDDSIVNIKGALFDSNSNNNTISPENINTPDSIVNNQENEKLQSGQSDDSKVIIEGVLIDKETGGIPVDDSIYVKVDSSVVMVDSSGEFSSEFNIKEFYLITVISKKYQTLQKTITFENRKKNYFITVQLEKKSEMSKSIDIQKADTANIPWTISGTIVDSRFDLVIESIDTKLLFDNDAVFVTEKSNFVVTTFISGTHTFHLTIPGYQTVTYPIVLDEKEKQPFVTIATTIPGKAIERREITVSAKRLPVHRSAHISRVDIPRKELQRTAATLNDPIRVLHTLPGVASESDASARPVVRGGDVHESRVFLDGIPLLQPYHYGGARSTFNQQSINKLTFYKAGFPAELHNAQSALIEAYSRIPSEEKISVEADLNLLQYSAYVGIPLYEGKAGLNFSSQGSYSQQIFKLIMKVGEGFGNEEMKNYGKLINIPDYQDFSAGFSISPSPQLKLFFNEVYNTDKTKFTQADSAIDVTYNYYKYDSQYNRVFDTSVTVQEYYYEYMDKEAFIYREPISGKYHDRNPVIGKPYLDIDTIVDYKSKFNILYSKIQYIPSEKSIFNVTVAWQKRWWDLNFPASNYVFDTAIYDVNINQFNLNAGWVYSGIDKHLIKSGFQIDYTRAKYDVFIIRYLHRLISSGSTNFSDFWGAVNGDTAMTLNSDSDESFLYNLMERIAVFYKGKRNFANVASYISDGWDISNRLHCDIGTRIEYSKADHETKISPRLSMKYNISEKNELLGSIGLYTQNNYEIGVIELSEKLKPEKVWHGDVGLESKLLPWLTQKVDVYGKYYYDLASEIVGLTKSPSEEEIMEYLKDHYNLDNIDIDTIPISTLAEMYIRATLELNRYSTRYVNDGRGGAYGLEYMLRYDPTDFWHGWISLSLGQSIRQRREGWKKHPFPLDRPILISVNNYYRLPRKYEISLKYRYMSGLPYTSVESKNDQVRIGAFNDSRYIAYHRIDIRFSKGFSIRGAKGNFYTEIWNAMNAPNAFAIDSKTRIMQPMGLINMPVTMLYFGVECSY